MSPPDRPSLNGGSAGVVTDPGIAIRRLAHDDLDLVEPLWDALRRHHAQTMPELGPPRSRADSWERRRHEYEHWLHEPGAFMLVAELDGEAVGYAMVRLRPASPTWALGERAGELETLSVLPEAQGRGAGSALLAAVREQLRELGATELTLHVLPGNEGALGFYEKRGFRTNALWLGAPVEPARRNGNGNGSGRFQRRPR